jgi:hypothetical protein
MDGSWENNDVNLLHKSTIRKKIYYVNVFLASMVPYPLHARRFQGGANATRVLAAHDRQLDSDYSFLTKILQPIEQRVKET